MQGVVLHLTLSRELPRRVLASNSKAAFFGTLDALAKLSECRSMYWGFEKGDRKRIVIVVGCHEHAARRSTWPLDRLRPFFTGTPRVYATEFPSGLRAFETQAEITITLARSDALQECATERPNPYAPPGCTKQESIFAAMEDEWVEIGYTDQWVAMDIKRTGPGLVSSIGFPPCSRGILTPGEDLTHPRLIVPSADCVTFSMISQKYHVSAAISYTACRAEARDLEKQRRATVLLDELKLRLQSQAGDAQQEDEWVLVT